MDSSAAALARLPEKEAGELKSALQWWKIDADTFVRRIERQSPNVFYNSLRESNLRAILLGKPARLHDEKGTRTLEYKIVQERLGEYHMEKKLRDQELLEQAEAAKREAAERIKPKAGRETPSSIAPAVHPSSRYASLDGANTQPLLPALTEKPSPATVVTSNPPGHSSSLATEERMAKALPPVKPTPVAKPKPPGRVKRTGLPAPSSSGDTSLLVVAGRKGTPQSPAEKTAPSTAASSGRGKRTDPSAIPLSALSPKNVRPAVSRRRGPVKGVDA